MNRIKPFIERDANNALSLFLNIFDESEETYFSAAWRTREIGLGVWTSGRLIAGAIVCRNKLEYIFVEESFRRLGVGSLLLKEVMRLKPALYLVPVQSSAIFDWYEKHGFYRSSRVDNTVIYVRHPYRLRSHSRKSAASVQEGARAG